jgi:hypothetical protein
MPGACLIALESARLGCLDDHFTIQGRTIQGGRAMSDDLLSDARELRQKLQRLEVLLEIEKGPRSRSWFAGKAPQDLERPAAIKRLLDTGLIEPAPAPQHYRVTADGWEFLQALRARVGGSSGLDWTRVDEIEFSKL